MDDLHRKGGRIVFPFFDCPVCDIKFYTKHALNAHIFRQKHLKKLEILKKPKSLCEICNIETYDQCEKDNHYKCSPKFCHEAHLFSTDHRNKESILKHPEKISLIPTDVLLQKFKLHCEICNFDSFNQQEFDNHLASQEHIQVSCTVLNLTQ